MSPRSSVTMQKHVMLLNMISLWIIYSIFARIHPLEQLRSQFKAVGLIENEMARLKGPSVRSSDFHPTHGAGSGSADVFVNVSFQDNCAAIKGVVTYDAIMSHWLQSRICTLLFYSEKSCALFAIVPRLPFVSADLPSSSNWHNHWLDISLRTFHRNIFPLSITTQTLRPMHHRANHSVQWSSQMDLGCCEWFQVSGKAPGVCWVTTKSGVCRAVLGCSLMLADLGGQQRFVQFNRIIPRIKTEIPASKESSEAAVPCVQGRIFADGVDKKVTWDVLCLALNLGIKYLLPAHPALNIAQYREPLTHTRHSPKYIEGFFLPSRIWNHQIYLLFLSPSAEFRASQQSRWLELEHRQHQVHTNCRNDHIRAAKSPGVTEMSPGSAPDDIPAPCYQHQPALCSHTSSLNLHWSLSCSQLGQKHARRRKSVKNTL